MRLYPCAATRDVLIRNAEILREKALLLATEGRFDASNAADAAANIARSLAKSL